MKYFVCAIQGGYAVVNRTALGQLDIVMEAWDRGAAECAAKALQAQFDARMAAAQAARFREHALQPRRPVRWFEPDAFA